MTRAIDHKFHTTRPAKVEDAERPELRPSQREALATLVASRCSILNAPTGWGKTVVMEKMALEKLKADTNRLCIVTVPQKPIAKGFQKRRTFSDGDKWTVGHDLTAGRANDCLARLKRFLMKPRSRRVSDRVLLCCHRTLEKLHHWVAQRPESRTRYLTNLVLWVDEGHHVMLDDRPEQTAVRDNMLGAVVEMCVEAGAHVGLATATFLRMTGRVISSKLLPFFERVNIAWDTYFEEVQPIEGFTYDILCSNLWDAVEAIFRERGLCPTLIYLPYRQSLDATRNKSAEVQKIIERVGLSVGAAGSRRDGAITTLTGGTREVRVLDMATEKTQKEAQRFLSRIEGRDDVDVIIAQNMCKEGFDWPCAERAIILGDRHSVPEMIQTFGRLFRKADGKKKAEVFQIVSFRPTNKDEFREHKNRCLTVLLAAMLLEDVFLPPFFERMSRAGQDLSHDFVRLSDFFADADEFSRCVWEFATAVEGRTYQTSLHLMPAILNKYGIAEIDHARVWKALWVKLLRHDPRYDGFPSMTMELLLEINPIAGFLQYASTLLGAVTFKEVRRLYNPATTEAQDVATIERAAAENGGVVPPHDELKRKGHGRAVMRVLREPWLFFHLTHAKHPANRLKGPAAVDFVTKLIRANRDRVPAWQTLNNRGFARLASYISRNRDLFAHLKHEEAA